MFLKKGDQLIDFDLDLLEELVCVLDARLEKLDKEIQKCPDPDGWGLFDLAEGITGLGFVACQWYLAATYGCVKLDKSDALKLGPRHRSGATSVQLVNHAANYWKHCDEWALNKNEQDARRTREALLKAGINWKADYVLSCVFNEICPSMRLRFKHLIPVLTEWSKEVSRHSDTTRQSAS